MEKFPTKDLSRSIYELGDEIKKEYNNISDVILAIQKSILEHSSSLAQKYEPRDIIESRFTPATEAFDKGMTSCGAITNIATEILKYLGYKVKLVHGECKESVDHAWLSVYDETSSSWIEYDLTKKDCVVPSTHIKKAEADSWDDIKDQIIEDHNTLLKRRKEKEKNIYEKNYTS